MTPRRGWTLEVIVATSIDGKISTADRLPWRWSDPADHAWLLERMAAADLLVVGAGTIRSEDPTLQVPEELAARRREAGRPAQPARLVVSPGLSVPPDARILAADGPAVSVAATADAWRERGGGYPESVHRIDWNGDVAAVVGAAVERHGARTVLGLGGGRLNAALLQAELVDTVSHTISSFVVGGAAAPSAFDGDGYAPPAFRQFRLEETRPLGRDLLLRWARDWHAGPRRGDGGLD